MSKITLKLKLMQLQILNKGKIVFQHALDGTSYILDTNLYYGDIKLPKGVKMVQKYQNSYHERISFELRDSTSDEYLALIDCSSKKELHKSNSNNLLHKFIELNHPNITILQMSSLSIVLDSKMDIEQIKVPDGLTIKIDLYGLNDEVQCKILDINDKQIGVLNCKCCKQERKIK